MAGSLGALATLWVLMVSLETLVVGGASDTSGRDGTRGSHGAAQGPQIVHQGKGKGYIKMYRARLSRNLSPEVISDAGFGFAGVSLDFWPENKCDNGTCPWVGASVLDGGVRFWDPSFRRAVAALGPELLVRVGGTQQDTVRYDGFGEGRCSGMVPAPPAQSRGFTGGCLLWSRWLEVMDFCESVRCRLVFGVNGMRGRGAQASPRSS